MPTVFAFEEVDAVEGDESGPTDYHSCDLCGRPPWEWSPAEPFDLAPMYRTPWKDGTLYRVCLDCLPEWMEGYEGG